MTWKEEQRQMAWFEEQRIKKYRSCRMDRIRRDEERITLDVIRSCLGLSLTPLCPGSRLEDVVLLAIHAQADFASVRSIGISILDTRQLKTRSSVINPALIATHDYTIRKTRNARVTNACNFGTSRCIDLEWIPTLMRKLLRTGSPDPEIRERRKVILVGHRIDKDFDALEKLPSLSYQVRKVRVEMATAILDTSSLWRQVFEDSTNKWTPAPHNLVDALGIDRENVRMQNAGNEANLTLKTLLKLALARCPDQMTAAQSQMRMLVETTIEENTAGMPSIIEGMCHDIFKRIRADEEVQEQEGKVY